MDAEVLPTLQVPPETIEFIRAMPKAEIHVHLEGSISPETLLALAQRHRRLDALPVTKLDELRRWFHFTDFPHFIQVYLTISELLRTPDDFSLAVYACGQQMANQAIRYREVTVTPYTHTDLQRKGLTIVDILEGLDAGRRQAERDFGVKMNWIFDVPRNASFPEPSAPYDPHPAERTLEYALAGRAQGVVGFGLGGFEVGAPPEPFGPVFAAAKREGLLLAPHAGETVGPASVWGAVRALAADRIGHGVRAIEDAHLLAHLAEAQIPLEICPTSNVCLHVYRRLAEHPFPHLDRMGLVVTVNSDDPPLFGTTLCEEYAMLAAQFGYGSRDLARIARNAFVVCAAIDKVELLAHFDTWVAANLAPPPRSP